MAECDFMNPAANGECGAWSALNWGSFNQTTTVNPAVLEGWGTRNRDWQVSGGVQQQIAPQIAVEVTYNRRIWSNFYRDAQPCAHGSRLRRSHAPRAQG